MKKTKNQIASFIKYNLTITIRSPKIYIYSLIIPLILFISIYLVRTNFGQNNIYNKANILSIITIIPICSFLFIGYIVINWRESIFISQIKVIRIKRISIILSLMIVCVILSWLSIMVNILSIVIIDCFLSHHNFINAMASLNSFSKIISFIVFQTLIMVFVFSISMIVSLMINSPMIIQTVNIIMLLIFVIFGDTIVDRNNISTSSFFKIYSIIEYFIPINSFQWLYMIGVFDVVFDHQNVNFIVSNPYIKIPYTFGTNNINAMISTTVIESLLLLCLTIVSLKYIKLNKIK